MKTKTSVPEAVSVGAVAAGQSTDAGHVCAAEPPLTNLRLKLQSSSLAVGLENVQVVAPHSTILPLIEEEITPFVIEHKHYKKEYFQNPKGVFRRFLRAMRF